MTSSLLVPVITPLHTNGAIDIGALGQVADHVLSNGAAGIVLFGTLGEGQSFSVQERQEALEQLIARGADPAAIVLGIGANAQPDAVALARHGLRHGVHRQLLLPPFFFKGLGDEGVYRFFSTTIEAISDDTLRLMLYDIPPLTQVTLAPAVVTRLIEAHGDVIHGLKDSVPDRDHVEQSVRTFPGLQIFVGNEIFLPTALALGGSGAISGLGNIAPTQMAAIATGKAGEGSEVFARMCALYDAISAQPVIPTVKALAAVQFGQPDWGVPRLPLSPVDLGTMPAVTEALDGLLSAKP